MKTRKIIAALLALACIVALAACGTTPPEETASPDLTTPGLTSPTPDEVLPDEALPDDTTPDTGDLAYILAKGQLIIGVTEYEPMNFKDDSGAWTGFDTEFAEAVCAILGVEPVFQEIDWNSKETELKGRTIDCIWNGLTVDDDRRLNMDFSTPYLSNEQVVVIMADVSDSVTDKGSLGGFTVAVEEGSAGETAAAELDGAIVIPVQTQAAALLEVKSGTADAAVIDSTMAFAMTGAGTEYAELAVFDLSLTAEEYAIGFRLGSDVTMAVDNAIATLLADGTLEAIAEKYGLNDRLVK
ncbi:MAG: transporter substrate-binding domain-containing protein [Oscillospiraceae bacterium]|jgi:polar amino acid transport system substrate-binding protein|nr:transporter substrate-binding domain-containing protein [Oscillospiraceae bacterium]